MTLALDSSYQQLVSEIKFVIQRFHFVTHINALGDTYLFDTDTHHYQVTFHREIGLQGKSYDAGISLTKIPYVKVNDRNVLDGDLEKTHIVKNFRNFVCLIV